MRVGRERGIFDVNCLNSGGWVSLADWSRTMVPYILRECHPKANGEWHLTHSIEIQRARRRQPSAVGQGVSTTETQSHGEEYV
jgi:hypothetical protein